MHSDASPTGTVTFLFTDIEGSTRLWEIAEEHMRAALARHDELLTKIIVANGGHVFKTIGDAFCAAFDSASDALVAAVDVQRAVISEPWPEAAPIRIRLALHTGAVESRARDYFGPPVNRVARLLAIGHGGQTIISEPTRSLVSGHLPPEVSLRDLGSHRLKDLASPELVFQVQHPEFATDFPPLRSLSTHPNNLPLQLTSFIGREREMADLRALVPRSRLLTLTGAGGCGKTRLGLQFAAELLESFPDGVWFAELAPITEPALVTATVAGVLGIRDESGKPVVEALVEHLRGRRLLLILDNCEHLVGACASFVAALMSTCPDVHIVASSREPLGIAGEQTFRVPSLSLPDPSGQETVESLSQYEAVRLFVDRALLSRPDFEVTKQSASALASVCFRLDGIPLAIELAAARARSLSVEEIDDRLDQRFRLLTGGSRSALPRQQTLRSLIDWSYNLLTEPERLLFQRISVFSGGWMLEAAEAVCTGTHEEGVAVLAPEDMVDLLDSLAEKSLLVVEHTGGRTRFRALETIREYANDRLVEAGCPDLWRQRHLEYFVRFAEAAEVGLESADQVEWLDRLEADHDNLRSALNRAGKTPDDFSLALRMVGSLSHFWWIRAYCREGLAHGVAALGRSVEAQEPGARAKALRGAGALAAKLGDRETARDLHLESLEIRRSLGDLLGTASSAANLGILAQEEGDYEFARTCFEDAAVAFRDLGNTAKHATSLICLAEIAMAVGDDAEAERYLTDGLAVARQADDQICLAAALGAFAQMHALRGDFARAEAMAGEAQSTSQRLGFKRGLAWALEVMGYCAGGRGEFPRARELYAKSIAGFAAAEAVDGLLGAIDGLGIVCSLDGSLEFAATLWGASDAHRVEHNHPRWPSDEVKLAAHFQRVQLALGDVDAFDLARRQGAELTLDELVRLATRATVVKAQTR